MRKLLKYWNDNKRKILIIVGVIALVLVCIRLANEMVKMQKKNNNISTNTSKVQDVTKPSQSIITGEELNEKQVEDNSEIIKNFVKYCNEKDVQNAYELLSTECKQILYPERRTFEENYINKIFTTSKTYKLELWNSNKKRSVYQIKYYENNLLATGGATMDSNTEDYITIVEENNQKKLNLNSFISYETLNKNVNKNNIQITINNRKVYRTYEEYNITIKNNTTKTILISGKKNGEDISLIDENNAKYVSLLHEVPEHLLNIKPGYQSNISLRFNKIYNEYRKVKTLRFENIVLDYDKYDSNSNSEEGILSIDAQL